MTVSAKGERKLKSGWLDLFPGAISLPVGQGVVTAGGAPVAARIEDVTGAEEPAEPPPSMAPLLPEEPPPVFAPRRVRPSAASGNGAPGFAVLRLGPRLPLAGHADMRLMGEAVHGFMAADRPSASGTWREALARRLLTAWEVSALDPGNLLRAADRFWTHLAREYPDGVHRREWPLARFAGGQLTHGRADLVVEHAGGLALYDHKTFPGGEDRWTGELQSYAPQLDAYADLLGQATGRTVTRQAVHLAIAGVVLLPEGTAG